MATRIYLQESVFRLQTLGCLSDLYDHVASVETPEWLYPKAEDLWELKSIRSERSTTAVASINPVPKRTAGNNTRPISSPEISYFGEHYISPLNSPLREKSYDAFNTAHLRPAESFRRSQHPAILTPGFQGACINYSGHDSGVVEAQSKYTDERYPVSAPATPMAREDFSSYADDKGDHPAVLCPVRWSREISDNKTPTHTGSGNFRPQISSYAQFARSNHSSSPITQYSSYRPREVSSNRGPLDQPIYTSVSLCESPTTYSAADIDKDTDHAHRNHGNENSNGECSYSAILSGETAYLAQRDGLSSANERSSSQGQPHSFSGPTMRVRGVEFEMVTPIGPIPTPASTSAPVPAPIPTHLRSPLFKPAPSSSSNQQTSPSCHQHPSTGYGAWNPESPKQPSFFNRAQARLQHKFRAQLVKAGWKAPPSFKVNAVHKIKSPTSNVQMLKESPTVPPSPTLTFQESTEKVAQEPVHAEGGDSASRESDKELAYVKFQSQAVWPLGPTPAPGTTIAALRGMPSLYVDTSAKYQHLEDVAELESPPTSTSSEDKREDGKGPAYEVTPTQSSYGTPSPGETDMCHPASCSFPPGHAELEGDDTPHRRCHSTEPQKPSHSSASLPREKMRRPRSIPLSREQLEFAALPSPLEHLKEPFPFDARRNLPSQSGQQNSADRCTLSRSIRSQGRL
ncbi:hypothetical protein NUW58_g5754 [Xylaria curta]|uniref:Uncharacterized protein n=1 Tax=Xylaria curta TaxID=42375 RepID=A0ACC1P0M0_9PEZI|nr:hypothetical protein NUW58_g5754 [Xylaria curta]